MQFQYRGLKSLKLLLYVVNTSFEMQTTKIHFSPELQATFANVLISTVYLFRKKSQGQNLCHNSLVGKNLVNLFVFQVHYKLWISSTEDCNINLSIDFILNFSQDMLIHFDLLNLSLFLALSVSLQAFWVVETDLISWYQVF